MYQWILMLSDLTVWMAVINNAWGRQDIEQGLNDYISWTGQTVKNDMKLYCFHDSAIIMCTL